MGKNNGILIVIGLIVVVVGAVLLFPTDTKEKDFMEVQFYDSDGNKIYDTNTLATVGFGGTEYNNVKYVGFKINVENTGDIPITISYLTVSPTQLDSALTKTTVTLNTKGQVNTWTSSLIDVTPFLPSSSEIQKTQAFAVTLRGTYTSQGVTQNVDKSASMDLIFKNDADTGGYTVAIGGLTNTSGSSSIYCGNGACESGESTTNCVADCGSSCGDGVCNGNENLASCVSDCKVCGDGTCSTGETSSNCASDCLSKIKFRTTDTNYNSATLLALDQTPLTCGQESVLSEYKYGGYGSSSACTGTSVASTYGTAPGGYPIVVRTGYDITSRVYIYKGGNCYYFVPQTATGGVSVSPNSVNSALEIAC